MLETDKIYCMDCLEGMKLLEDKSVDCIITDPPYGINYHSNMGSVEYKKRLHVYTWDNDFSIKTYFDDMWRVLKDDADMFIFGKMLNYPQMCNLNGFKQVLIWWKASGGMGDLTVPALDYECIFYFKKGKRPLNQRLGSVYKHLTIQRSGEEDPNPGIGMSRMKHPTQKPKGIIVDLLSLSTNKGDLVLDCFLGSGTTALACKQLNRRFIGFEISQKYVDIANKRLQQETVQKWF